MVINTYEIDCPVCDIKTVIDVYYDDDSPRHCPMCGEDVEATEVSEE